MVDEFPSNSHAGKEGKPPITAKVRPAIEQKKVEQIAKGEVIRRKKPIGKRMKEMFFGGDAKGALGFVAMDVLIPAAKDMIADAGREAIERMVFGESRGRSRRGFGSPGHVRYDGYSRGGGAPSSPWGARPEPKREVSRKGRSMHDFDEIILESRGEAEQVIDTLFDMVSQYSQATVADLYELVGITSAYTDQKYGWTNLQGANVSHVRGGAYLLNLPKPEPLD